MQSRLPLIQDSIDRIIPQINLVIESRLQAHIEDIRESLQETELAAIRRHNATNKLLSQLATSSDGRVSVVAKLASKPSAIAELGSYISTCTCLARKSNTSKNLHFGSLHLKHNVVPNKAHGKECPLYVANLEPLRKRTITFTGIIKTMNIAIQLSFCAKTGAGGLAINPSLMYFGVVDGFTAPGFQVIRLLHNSLPYKCSETYYESCLKAVIRKLQELFGSGRARPTDIDQNGDSLLQMISDRVSR